MVNGVDDIEAEVLRARLSFEEGLREASRASSRAARRVLTPAVIGVGLVGGALLALAVYRLLARPRSNGALIRIVIEPPRAPRKLLPAVGGALARWALERQLRSGGGPLGLLGAVLGDARAPGARQAIDVSRGPARSTWGNGVGR